MTTRVTTAEIPEYISGIVREQVAPAIGMVGWWLLCVVYPVFAGVLGAMYGCIVGTACGLSAGISEAKADLERLSTWMVKK